MATAVTAVGAAAGARAGLGPWLRAHFSSRVVGLFTVMLALVAVVAAASV